jgi:hypothetical protein
LTILVVDFKFAVRHGETIVSKAESAGAKLLLPKICQRNIPPTIERSEGVGDLTGFSEPADMRVFDWKGERRWQGRDLRRIR